MLYDQMSRGYKTMVVGGVAPDPTPTPTPTSSTMKNTLQICVK